MKKRDQRQKRRPKPRLHGGSGNFIAEQAFERSLRKAFEDAGYKRIYRLEEMGVIL